MSPKSLSEDQRDFQRRNILEQGKASVLQYGFKRVSVDDIARAAGIAKGTFYLYFRSKEDFLMQLLSEISENYFVLAEKIILSASDGLSRETVRKFFNVIFDLPEVLFYFRNHREIDDLMGRWEKGGFSAREKEGFHRILTVGNFDTQKVVPEVVHNYIHAVYLAKTTDLMLEEYKQATVDLLTDGLIRYIFEGREA